MYSSRGTNAYGQQPYVGQSGYSQNLGAGYSGSSVGGPDGGAQMSLSSRHSSILGSSQDVELGGYRALPSVSAHYGGQYSSIYGTTALSATQQVPDASSKGARASALEARNAYASALTDSPKIPSTDYVSSSNHGYSHKGDQMYAEKIPDYPTLERRQFGERQGGYLGRDLPSEPTGRYSDSAIFGHQHQPDIYDRLDQAVLLRQEQLLKAQSASHDSSSRQADYLAARSAASRHSTQDLLSYGGRIDADPRISSLLSSSYGGQTPSILGAAPRRNVDDLMYPPSSTNPGYGVSLPPGRDYGTKGLHVTTIESEYPDSTLSRNGHPRIDERKDDRAGYLREFEMREEERRREHLREREKDKERERERERLRERDRECERLRILERRGKERERERKRVLEVTRERTPPRVSRDHRGPSLTKEVRPLRRESPRREVTHRRLSPLKEKRREYVCKVYSSNLTDVERGYLSIAKRYPRLFVSPEFSKVVINWPKDNLKLSLHTHVSFEHDFVEDSLAESKELSSKFVPTEPERPEQGSTVWNAKMILMSGLSRSALEELSSEKAPDDRIAHICNIIRFVVLKKDHSFMAIGGPSVSADGSTPAGDEFSLVQTAHRYAKDVVNLDLQKCQHWNPFLEIHYDRTGKDGLFSHKEVTVLFVPDLSECLPSLDTWRSQWLAHRKAVSEREHQLSLKREKSKERKEGSKDKEVDPTKLTEKGKAGKKIPSVSSSPGVIANKKEKDDRCIEGGAAEGKVTGAENKVQVKDASELTVEGGPQNKESGEAPTPAAAKTGAVKSVKKKIIKRIVKQKVANKAAVEVKTASKRSNGVDEEAGDQNNKWEIFGQQEESSAGSAGMKTFVRKKITRKEAVGKNDQCEDNGVPLEAKGEMGTGCSEDKPKDNSDATPAAVENASVKTTIKRKIIKRVPKRKVPATKAKDEVAEIKNGGDEDGKKVVQAGDETYKQTGSEKQGNPASSSKSEIKSVKENKKDEKLITKAESPDDKKKVNMKDASDLKGRKLKEVDKPKDDKVCRDESRSNSSKESKEKRKPEEPSLKHPGLILHTKWSKDSKLRSSSLSLDSLLDYTDKDIEEPTFELSLFAEVMYEMLQYQMGCRILTFLQKLRVRFMAKRNQSKRQREEIHDKETVKKSPMKKLKSNELPVKENESAKADASSVPPQAQQDVEMTVTKEETTADHVEEPTMEAGNNAGHVEEPNIKDEIDEEEDPEEDPEEYEEMDDASPQSNSSNEKNDEKEPTDAKPDKEVEKDEAVASTKLEITTKSASMDRLLERDMSRKEQQKVDPKKVHATNKYLLQAFRFFDRNRVGYIRVEDMRLIIHSLGKFLSHRDVKELVQSALLESNTRRDDHILYDKLVQMCDI